MNGGAVAQTGFYIQNVVTLIDALQSDELWDYMVPEPDTGEDKVDYAFYFKDQLIRVVQVKSSKNPFKFSDVKRWILSLNADGRDAKSFGLVLVGNTDCMVQKLSVLFSNPCVINQNSLPKKLDFLAGLSGKKLCVKNYNNDSLSAICRDALCSFTTTYLQSVTDWSILDELCDSYVGKLFKSVSNSQKWYRTELIERLKERVSRYIKDIQENLTPVLISSFSRGVQFDGEPQNKLNLINYFDGKRLKTKCTWADVLGKVVDFIEGLNQQFHYRLQLEVGYTLAFAIGRYMDAKSGLRLSLVQKTQNIGSQLWKSETPYGSSKSDCIEHRYRIGTASDIAYIIGITHDIQADVRAYINTAGIQVGDIVCYEPEYGANPYFVRDGNHASLIANEIANSISSFSDKAISIFIAAPVSVCFFLGQFSHKFGPITMYENNMGGIPAIQKYFRTYLFLPEVG